MENSEIIITAVKEALQGNVWIDAKLVSMEDVVHSLNDGKASQLAINLALRIRRDIDYHTDVTAALQKASVDTQKEERRIKELEGLLQGLEANSKIDGNNVNLWPFVCEELRIGYIYEVASGAIVYPFKS